MGERRSSRPKKDIPYSSLVGDESSDDEDFIVSKPQTTKVDSQKKSNTVKENKPSKEPKNNRPKENTVKNERKPLEKKEEVKKRLPLDEKLLMRDIQKAVEISRSQQEMEDPTHLVVDENSTIPGQGPKEAEQQKRLNITLGERSDDVEQLQRPDVMLGDRSDNAEWQQQPSAVLRCSPTKTSPPQSREAASNSLLSGVKNSLKRSWDCSDDDDDDDYDEDDDDDYDDRPKSKGPKVKGSKIQKVKQEKAKPTKPVLKSEATSKASTPKISAPPPPVQTLSMSSSSTLSFSSHVKSHETTSLTPVTTVFNNSKQPTSGFVPRSPALRLGLSRKSRVVPLHQPLHHKG